MVVGYFSTFLLPYFPFNFPISAFCALSIPVLGQQGKMITVVVKEGQHIQDLAAEYLNDANLWTEILRVNSLSSVSQVRVLIFLSELVEFAGNETSFEEVFFLWH